MILAPIDILIVCSGSSKIKTRLIQHHSSGDLRTSASVCPAMYFGMTVGEREAGGTVVIKPRHVTPSPGTGIRGIVTGHVYHEVAPIDHVLGHVEEDKDFGRRNNLRRLGIYPVFCDFWFGRAPTAVGPAESTHIQVHGHG